MRYLYRINKPDPIILIATNAPVNNSSNISNNFTTQISAIEAWWNQSTIHIFLYILFIYLSIYHISIYLCVEDNLLQLRPSSLPSLQSRVRSQVQLNSIHFPSLHLNWDSEQNSNSEAASSVLAPAGKSTSMSGNKSSPDRGEMVRHRAGSSSAPLEQSGMPSHTHEVLM